MADAYIFLDWFAIPQALQAILGGFWWSLLIRCFTEMCGESYNFMLQTQSLVNNSGKMEQTELIQTWIF